MAMQVGLQLYALRNEMKKDLAGVLEKVAAAGYRQVEIADRMGMPAKELKALMDHAGLNVMGAHIGSVDRDSIESELDFYGNLGVKYIVCGNDFFSYGVPSSVLNRCDDYNFAGALCRERGMTLLYHNHFQEFQRLCRIPSMEWILENTDPALVSLELDVYWTARAGIDPIDFLKRYADRVAILHLKDFPADAPQNPDMFDGLLLPYQKLTPAAFDLVTVPECFTELGDGILPLREIMELGRAAGIPWAVIDQDFTRIDPYESIRRNKAFFEQFDYAAF